MLKTAFYVAVLLSVASADLFCGEKNCYSLLNVSAKASQVEIKKSFYKLSLLLHPDKSKAPDAEARFREVANAYEILSDEKNRATYDDVIAHPERHLTNAYYYYSFRAQQVALWKVLIGTLLFSTVAHFLYWWSTFLYYQKAVLNAPQIQSRVKSVLRAKTKNKTLSESINESNLTAKDLNVQLAGWQGRAPEWRDLLIFTLFVDWPFSIAKFIYFQVRWLVLFTLLGRNYGPNERAYLTSRVLGLPWNVFECFFPRIADNFNNADCCVSPHTVFFLNFQMGGTSSG
eukprot:TRINITY_DN897_c0_g2_i1.p1 TRINITY_DN897_c0_g2~~TRINITY_DN897_c0_g2_i1.p1  ORF type:complete len:287 (+),score=22.13 TRINITY_DN897_c0_g2_i1:93-953(+)